MSVCLLLALLAYPYGWFGPGPASTSDAGMMLEKGVFALDYNPSGLAWIDSLEVGAAAEGLFSYNLFGAAYKYEDWPMAASVHHTTHATGFCIGAGYLYRPLAAGAAFSASFDTLKEQTFSLRAGLQWGEYVGLAVGPRLWTAADTAHVGFLGQVGAAVPVIEGLDFLLGGAAEFGPPHFRIGGGLAYEPFSGFVIESLVSTEEWGAGLILDNVDDRGGFWVRRAFEEGSAWQFGLAYVRNIRGEQIHEVVVYRNLPPRVDTVYVTQAEPPPKDTTVHVVSPDVRKKQERLMAKANRYYAQERYEDALAVWREVVELDPSSDLAVRAREDIRDVTALMETLERIRSGRGGKSQPQ